MNDSGSPEMFQCYILGPGGLDDDWAEGQSF